MGIQVVVVTGFEILKELKEKLVREPESCHSPVARPLSSNQTLDISDVQPAPSGSGTHRLDYGRTSEDVSFYGVTFKARLDF